MWCDFVIRIQVIWPTSFCARAPRMERSWLGTPMNGVPTDVDRLIAQRGWATCNATFRLAYKQIQSNTVRKQYRERHL